MESAKACRHIRSSFGSWLVRIPDQRPWRIVADDLVEDDIGFIGIAASIAHCTEGCDHLIARGG